MYIRLVQSLTIGAAVLLSQLFLQAGLVWPTPNSAFQKGQPIETFVQATASGVPESGLFGCVRNGGGRFHEGLDLFPVARDRRGEATDAVYAVLPGRIAHVSQTAAHSSYGRYIVVVHDQQVPAFHTLYAHLASIGEGIIIGARVESGAKLGIMGRSASYSIPSTRAHLHFEIGFRLTNDFQGWYNRQKFGSKNRHGMWNGMNLVSINPLDFYESIRQGQVSNLYEYLKLIPAIARIRVHASNVPDFVKEYPSLVTRSYAGKQLVAWDIAFSQYGVPKEWTPRFAEEAIGGRLGDVKIIAYSPKLLKQQNCRRVLDLGGTKPKISSGSLSTLKKLFGFK
ncbi:MAG: M23 family metallopeptidase [Opitutae bacterium]|jgi:peptidoglycan LD-endopeptidase LytH|nr:M23 family metallopeptidase [Opitutae bacterium]